MRSSSQSHTTTRATTHIPQVEVTVGESGETLTAYIYLWRDESDPRLVHGKDWDYGGWREKWLSHFAPMVKGWSEWYRNEQKGEFVLSLIHI